MSTSTNSITQKVNGLKNFCLENVTDDPFVSQRYQEHQMLFDQIMTELSKLLPDKPELLLILDDAMVSSISAAQEVAYARGYFDGRSSR